MRRSLLVVPVLSLAFASVAFAGDPPKGGAAPASEPVKTDAGAAAQDLFDQGIKLMTDGKFAEACPKLEASNRAAWAPGTTINLADCYEHVGRLASAWAKFLEAEPHFRNRTPPDPRADIAKKRAEALYPKLSRVEIDVPDASKAPGLVVKRDGDVVDESQWGNALPVDAGKHVVEVTAPGRVAWKWEADVQGTTPAKVEVPALVASATASTATATASGAPTTAPTESGMATQKKIAIGAGALGVAGLVLGGVTGVLTLGKVADSNKTCAKLDDGTFRCDAAGGALRDDAKSLSTISTIGFIAGGVLAAGGVVLWLTAPSGAPSTPDSNGPAPKTASARRSLWISPAIGPTSGVTVGGDF
ncbi:MAG: hypothetical protein U0441_04140 [Polyangiaceae bacterium]